eukprot:1500047-Rhodomonas_salina.3
MSGTHIAYLTLPVSSCPGLTQLDSARCAHARYPMPGTDIEYLVFASCLCECVLMIGADNAYPASRHSRTPSTQVSLLCAYAYQHTDASAISYA